jgi:uncharacterized protein YjiK
MTAARGLVLLVCALPFVGACRDTPQARAAQANAVKATRMKTFETRLGAADADSSTVVPVAMWLMPPELREISGLAITPRGTVLTHDDNVGRVYEIDPKTGILLKGFALRDGVRGDFEAITIAGTDVYLLESKGKIFKFKEGKDAEQVPYSVYDTGLRKTCEFESMAFEADSSRLVLVCKRILTKPAPHEMWIYRIPLPLGDHSAMSMLRIPIADVIGSNKWKNFHSSDINIDPITKNYVIVSSNQKGLVVIRPDGEVVRSEPLPGDHRQPEGVAVTQDSLLLVTDESNVHPAALTLYRWRP